MYLLYYYTITLFLTVGLQRWRVFETISDQKSEPPLNHSDTFITSPALLWQAIWFMIFFFIKRINKSGPCHLACFFFYFFHSQLHLQQCICHCSSLSWFDRQQRFLFWCEQTQRGKPTPPVKRKHKDCFTTFMVSAVYETPGWPIEPPPRSVEPHVSWRNVQAYQLPGQTDSGTLFNPGPAVN